MAALVHVVQELSLARTIDQVQAIVRKAARALTGADGATFVLRDGDMCFYADEEAIAPLWKGSRFPMNSCISGWAMLNRRPAVIEDIYADDRVPHDAYRPTFVKSLAMVPIRTLDPLGAIGNYWASRHLPTPAEVELLTALADVTAVAIENVRILSDMDERVTARTAELEEANDALREFVAVAAHDIRGPLTAIRFASELLQRDDVDREQLVDIISRQSVHLDRLVSDLMTLSLCDSGHLEIKPQEVVVREILDQAVEEVTADVEVDAPEGLVALVDRTHLQRIAANFLRNAERHGRPPFSVRATATDDTVEIRVIDSGPGVPADIEDKLFERFTRSAASAGKEGAGLGLSISAALARANGGAAFYERAPTGGACFGARVPVKPC